MRDMSESSHPPLHALRQLRTVLEHGMLHNLGRPALEAALLGKIDAMLVALAGCEKILRTYTTQGSNPRRADPRQVCGSHVRALPWAGHAHLATSGCCGSYASAGCACYPSHWSTSWDGS